MTAIGILGEHETDCKTIAVLVRRIVPREIGIQQRAPISGGCGALRRRAAGFMKDLARAGCSAIVLVHDLDLDPDTNYHNDEPSLRAKLERISAPSGVHRLICIPIEELEAWFWSDQKVLDLVGK